MSYVDFSRLGRFLAREQIAGAAASIGRLFAAIGVPARGERGGGSAAPAEGDRD